MGVNLQTGTSYTIQQSDNLQLVVFSSNTAVTASLVNPASNCWAGFFTCSVEYIGTVTLTLTPTAPATIDGASSLTIYQDQGLILYSDGTNWYTVRGGGSPASSLIVGTTTITGGVNGNLLYDNNGVLGEKAAIAYDLLSNRVNAENAVSNPSGSTLSANTWNVITATAACNAKLPAPTDGHVIGIRIDNSSTNLFTLNPNNTEKIQPGANSSRILWAGESAVLISNDTDWIKVAGVTIPMVCTLYQNSVSQSISNNTGTKVTSLTAYNDPTGLMADAANSQIKILRPNTYDSVGVVRYTSLTANASRCLAEMVTNGVNAITDGEIAGLTGGFPSPTVVTPLINLVAGNTVQLYTLQITGATQATLSTTTLSTHLTIVERLQW